MKVYVAVLVLFDALNTGITAAWMYTYLISSWGNASVFSQADWMAASDPVMIVLIACMVELFFAWRLYVIGRQRWVTMIIVIFSVLELLSGIGTGIAVIWVKEYTLFPRFKVIAILWTVTGAVADVFIALGMTYYLRQAKGSYKATDRLVDKIILLTLQNGALMTVAFAVHLALYLGVVKPYYIALSFVMPKLYSNSVLASLNSRRILRPLASATVLFGERSLGDSRVFASNTYQADSPEVVVEIHQETQTDARNSHDYKC